MKLSIEFEGPSRNYGIIGLWGLTASIQRKWRGDYETWRHISVRIVSPALIQPASLYGDGRPWWRRVGCYPMRFGYLASNYYLGVIYITTTFRSANLYGRDPYKRMGPITWVWDDGRYRADASAAEG